MLILEQQLFGRVIFGEGIVAPELSLQIICRNYCKELVMVDPLT